MASQALVSRGEEERALGPRAERTRAAILEAAEALFAARGFAATRLEDVAERVGIRRASIFYYFRDKADLYDAVLADVFGGLRERLEPALLAPGPVGARAEAAVSAWVDYVAERPSLARLLLREVADGTPEREPPLLRHTRPFFDLVGRLIAETDAPGAPASPVEPIHLASTVAGATVFFVAAMPTLLPGTGFDPLAPGPLEAHRAEMLAITRRLLGTDPANAGP
jgi:TetR/AcrR family transcriptional regulator